MDSLPKEAGTSFLLEKMKHVRVREQEEPKFSHLEEGKMSSAKEEAPCSLRGIREPAARRGKQQSWCRRCLPLAASQRSA